MTEKQLYEIAVHDLVKLSIKANNVISKGMFPGDISDEVKEVLDMCSSIYNTFVKEVKDEA